MQSMTITESSMELLLSSKFEHMIEDYTNDGYYVDQLLAIDKSITKEFIEKALEGPNAEKLITAAKAVVHSRLYGAASHDLYEILTTVGEKHELFNVQSPTQYVHYNNKTWETSNLDSFINNLVNGIIGKNKGKIGYDLELYSVNGRLLLYVTIPGARIAIQITALKRRSNSPHRKSPERIRLYESKKDIDLKPTDSMVKAAQRGLDLRKEYGRGGTEVGIARARDIVNRKNLSPDTVKRMYSFFSRHEVDKKASGWKKGEDKYPSNGLIAWLLWGGDPGFSWSKKKKNQLDKKD